MCQLIKDILMMLGVTQVATARDSEKAIAQLRTGGIDVLITEWALKPRSGLELLDWLRTDGMTPDRMMPGIMLTANSEVEYVMESRDKGGHEFLANPITADTTGTE